MSRLIIKNLPNKVTVEKLKETFCQKGEVTDVQLKYTKDGKFRNFGFIGYRTEEQASAAKEYFDGTCINSMKINVELCANLGDEKKPRAWSKYATDSSAYKKLNKNDQETTQKPLKDKQKNTEKNKNKIRELLKKHRGDPLFEEFIEAHVNDNTIWIKETLAEIKKSDNEDSGDEQLEQNEKLNDTNKDKNATKSEVVINDERKVANKQITDLEYMKLLMRKVGGESTDKNKEKDEEKPKKIRNRPLFYCKITGLPFKCKKKDVKEFFRPLVPFSLRLPLGKGKKLAGFCYVGFRTEKELKKALTKDKLFIGNHRVHIHKYESHLKKEEEEEQLNTKKRQERTDNEETVGESGSIFVRNLPYVVSEEEVTKAFEKYGPLADVNMPIDPILRQPKGFATITFVMPEHAVKAFTELDGTSFCGRMLHLLPAKTEKLENENEDESGLTFKEKKAKKLKAQAKSSHNWNTLFLGANAVANVVAANYSTTKEQLLSDENKNTSAAVRLALGETQLVAETRSFLEKNGVYLDAFNKPAQKRSKTCILVKNLPSDTDKDEIKAMFEKHGQIARFLMPKHGITALVDFIETFEAKKAFNKLAYSQFKAAPLYLEWAPENVFIKSTDMKEIKNKVENKEDTRKENEVTIEKIDDNTIVEEIEEETEVPENDSTIFIKNLNFKTTEENLEQHFRNCGKIHNVIVAKKKDPKNPGHFLSMGYGFVQFYKKTQANEALKTLQNSILEGKALELKRSERGNVTEVKTSKKSAKDTIQNGTKILVRNVPFQANSNELHEIFRAFGEIKTLRLPKKLTTGSEQHRGFAFVDFHSKADAKSAFEALCHSTHLYGRRLVLEWAEQTDENEDVNMLRKRTAEAFTAKVPGGKKTRKAAVDVENFVEGE